MECQKWKYVLIKWVNCLNLSESIKVLEDLRTGDFFTNLQKLTIKSPEADQNTLTFIFSILSKHYPNYIIENNAEISITDLSLTELIGIASLLMHYTCIHDRRDVLTSPLCYTLSQQTQLIIKNFLEKIDGTVTNNSLPQIIRDCIANDKLTSEWLSSVANSPTTIGSPLQNLLKTPISKFVRLQEKDKIIAKLKSELELEQFEKADLLEKLKNQENKTKKIEMQLVQKTTEISRLRDEVIALEDSSPPHYQDTISIKLQKGLKSEIESLEQYVRQIENEGEEIRKERDIAKDKLELLDSQCTIWQKKYFELETNFETLSEQSKLQEGKIEQLETHCNELSTLINEYKTQPSNDSSSGFDLQDVEDLACSVVEIQLREVQKNNEELTQQLNQIRSYAKKKDRENQEMMTKICKLESAYKNCKANLLDTERNLQSISEELNKQKEVSEKLQLSLGKAEALLEEFKTTLTEENTNLKAQLQDLGIKLKENEEEMEVKIQSLISQNGRYEEELINTKKNLDSVTEYSKEMETWNNKLQIQLDEVNALLEDTKLKNLNKLTNAKKEIEDLRNDLKSVNEFSKKLENDVIILTSKLKDNENIKEEMTSKIVLMSSEYTQQNAKLTKTEESLELLKEQLKLQELNNNKLEFYCDELNVILDEHKLRNQNCLEQLTIAERVNDDLKNEMKEYSIKLLQEITELTKELKESNSMKDKLLLENSAYNGKLIETQEILDTTLKYSKDQEINKNNLQMQCNVLNVALQNYKEKEINFLNQLQFAEKKNEDLSNQIIELAMKLEETKAEMDSRCVAYQQKILEVEKALEMITEYSKEQEINNNSLQVNFNDCQKREVNLMEKLKVTQNENVELKNQMLYSSKEFEIKVQKLTEKVKESNDCNEKLSLEVKSLQSQTMAQEQKLLETMKDLETITQQSKELQINNKNLQINCNELNLKLKDSEIKEIKLIEELQLIQNENVELKSRMLNSLEEYKIKIEELTSKLRESNVCNEQLALKVKTLKSCEQKLTETVKDLESITKHSKQLESCNNSLQAQCDELNVKLKDCQIREINLTEQLHVTVELKNQMLDSSKELEIKEQKLITELKESSDCNEKLSMMIKSMESQIPAYQEKLLKTEKKLESFIQQSEELQINNKNLQINCNELNVKLKDSEIKEIKLIEELQLIQNENVELKSRMLNSLEEYEIKIEELTSKLKESNVCSEQLTLKVKTLESCEQKLTETAKDLELITKRTKELESYNNNLQAQCDELNIKLKDCQIREINLTEQLQAAVELKNQMLDSSKQLEVKEQKLIRELKESSDCNEKLSLMIKSMESQISLDQEKLLKTEKDLESFIQQSEQLQINNKNLQINCNELNLKLKDSEIKLIEELQLTQNENVELKNQMLDSSKEFEIKEQKLTAELKESNNCNNQLSLKVKSLESCEQKLTETVKDLELITKHSKELESCNNSLQTQCDELNSIINEYRVKETNFLSQQNEIKKEKETLNLQLIETKESLMKFKEQFENQVIVCNKFKLRCKELSILLTICKWQRFTYLAQLKIARALNFDLKRNIGKAEESFVKKVNEFQQVLTQTLHDSSDHLNNKIETLNSKLLKQTQELNNFKILWEEQNLTIQDLKLLNNTLEGHVINSEGMVNNLSKKLKIAEKQLEDTVKENEEYKEKAKSMESQLQTTQNELESKSELYKKLTIVLDEYKTSHVITKNAREELKHQFNQVLENLHKEIQLKTTLLQEANEKYLILKNNNKELQEKCNNLETEKLDMTQKQEILQLKLNEAIKERHLENKNSTEAMKSLEETVQDYELTISGLKTVIETNLDNISCLRNEKLDLETEIDLLKADLTTIKQSRNEILESQDEILKETENNILRAHENAIDVKNDLLKKMENIEKEIEREREGKLILDSEKKCLENINLELIKGLDNMQMIITGKKENLPKTLEEIQIFITTVSKEICDIVENKNNLTKKLQELQKSFDENCKMNLLGESSKLPIKMEKENVLSLLQLNQSNVTKEDELKKKNLSLKQKLLLTENAKNNLEKKIKQLREDNKKLSEQSSDDVQFKSLLKEFIEVKEENEKIVHEFEKYKHSRKLGDNNKIQQELQNIREAYSNLMNANSKMNFDNNSLKKMLEERNIQLSEMSHIKEAYEKLLEENSKLMTEIDTIKYKRLRDKEEYARLLKREKNTQLTDNKRIQEVRTEYEAKLEKMKDKMLKVYREEFEKEAEKIKQSQNENVMLLKTLSKIKSELFEANHKIQLIEMERDLLKEKQESTIIIDTTKLQNTTSNLGNRYGNNRRVATLPRTNFEESITSVISSSNGVPRGLRQNLQMEDEDDLFNDKYLLDLKEGKCHIPENGRESVSSRMTQLVQRNSMVPAHLKSSYPAELQFLSPTHFKEDDIKTGNIELDDSLSKLLPGEKPRKKDAGTTSYRKPGPPTPSKNSRQLSLQGNEVHPLRTLHETKTPKRLTPSRIRALFTSKNTKDSSESQSITPRSRRLKIFRKPK